MAIARLNGEVIAESADTVLLDGTHYFPARSVRAEMLRPTGIKDNQHFFSVIVEGKPTADCACYHSGPTVPDPRVAEHVRFHAPVQIED